MKKILLEDAKKIVSFFFGEDPHLPEGITFKEFLEIKDKMLDEFQSINEAQRHRETLIEWLVSLF